MSGLAISSWSLHRDLGPAYWGLDLVEGRRAAAYPYGQGSYTLLDLPAVVAALGIQQLEICHFHFPETGAAYLGALRARLDAAQVQPLSLLIDEGDITADDAMARRHDLDRIRAWIDVAAALGAAQARVIAGLAAPSPDGAAVRRSAEGLALLADYGAARGVRVITENWLGISMDPDSLLAILRQAGAAVGLCVDFGNYTGPGKYEALAALLPHATSIHTKATFTPPGIMDRDEFVRGLDLARQARFDGPYVLIFDSEADERASLARMVEVVRPYLGNA
ncbi:MAG TPA: sugar phosphate isomerase/epimerase [Chloroflexota bacterium]|jgi:sugar phosphate isomerase/epimerase|nr:sugar phosphate isomerase/epimerase [Chloroflexota bacterium]